MDKFLNFNKVDESETELYIYGDIRKKDWIDAWLGTGDDVTNAFSLKDALAMVDTPNLTVRINSYGGSVSEGLAIYSLLSDFKGHLKTIVDGFACSAASVIFMAGDERIVPENGLLMIHNAWSYAEGDSNAMKKMAEDLEKITQPSVNIYVAKTGLDEETVKTMMDKESWITSQEAFDLGFSTSLVKKDSAKQSLEANYVYNLVMKNKELQRQIDERSENDLITIKCETLEAPIAISNEMDLIVDEQIAEMQKNMVKEDAWASFFNTKK